MYIDYVHLSRNLHIHYVRLVRILYIHYVRLRPTFILFINHEDNKRNSHDDGDDDNDYDDNFSCTCVAKMRTTKATVMATAMATIVPECNLIISDRTMWVEDLSSIGSSVNIKKPSLKCGSASSAVGHNRTQGADDYEDNANDDDDDDDYDDNANNNDDDIVPCCKLCWRS